MVKAKVKSLVAKLATGKPAPIVRVGLVAYRDRGDDYVTKVYPFSDDIDKVVKDISDLKANGGGDMPEAVNQGLHAAVSDLKWDNDNHTAKLLFLIGDAPPHQYANDFNWRDESKKAIARGVQINTIGCGGLDDTGTDVFKNIAKLADGKFDMLAYRTEVADASGKKSTYISSGGETYRVSDAAKLEWKDGAKALTAHGLAEKVAAPMAIGGAGGGFAYGAASRSLARGKGLMGAPTAASMEADVSMDRRDNNLDEVLFGAAKAKAAKSLNVEYAR